MDRNIQNRIQLAVDALCGENKSEFCRRIGRPAQAIKDIVGGKRSAPGFDLIYDILASDLGISPTWLLLGDGDMLVNKPTPAPAVSIGTIQTVNIGNWDELVEILKRRMNNG